MPNPISIETIQNALIEIRGQQVLLDSNVARIYGVETKRINEAVRNNPDKFPKDYLLMLSQGEWDKLRSKISTTNYSMVRTIPKAFTERGLYMLVAILVIKEATLSLSKGDHPQKQAGHSCHPHHHRNLRQVTRTQLRDADPLHHK